MGFLWVAIVGKRHDSRGHVVGVFESRLRAEWGIEEFRAEDGGSWLWQEIVAARVDQVRPAAAGETYDRRT